MKTITVAALNIVMPVPHSAERYIELFQEAFNLRLQTNLRGDFAGMIGSCRIEEIDKKNVIRGEIYKFFDLKIDGQWFNTDEQKLADEKEIAEIRIPSNLKPHFQIFPFTFIPSKHRLFFISKDSKENFSPGQAEKMLANIFSVQNLVEKYGEINITIEPSSESLEKIFSMPRLKSLIIEVTPPNPDDHEEAQKRLFEKLDKINADKQIIEYVSKDSEGLNPSEDIKTLAEIAKSNGKVSGTGEDQTGNTISVSTAAHPLLEKAEYNPKVQTRSEALLSKAFELLQQITGRT